MWHAARSNHTVSRPRVAGAPQHQRQQTKPKRETSRSQCTKTSVHTCKRVRVSREKPRSRIVVYRELLDAGPVSEPTTPVVSVTSHFWNISSTLSCSDYNNIIEYAK